MNEEANKYSSGGGGHFYKRIKGFTLIELLAVIIILGILLIIAIPSVTEYIVNSRKNVYISSIDGYVSGVSQKVNSLEYSFLDKDVTYYVHINNVPLEKGGESPFGEWLDAYVVVTYDGNGYDYYWTSVDDGGNKIILKDVDDITVDDVINDSYKEISRRRAVGNRNKIVIIDKDGNVIEEIPALEYTKMEAEKCYTYEKTSDGISISTYSKTCPKDVKIPSMIEGLPVTEIYSYAFYQRGINSVVIPDTVKIISAAAFSNNNLRYIELPSSVTTILSGAFRENLLTSLPDVSHVTNLASNAFEKNDIPEDEWFVYKKNSDGSYDYTRMIGYLGSKRDVIIPGEKNGVKLKSVTGFGSKNLKSVVIPDSVTSIEASAFEHNYLTNVKLPSGLKYIGQSAFYSNSLTNIEIPSTVTFIGTFAFNQNMLPDEKAFIYKRNSDGSIDYTTIISYGGANKNVIIPGEKNGVNLLKIETMAFAHSGLLSVKIPSSVTSIGVRAFIGNSLRDEDAIIYKRTEAGIDYSSIIGYGGSNKDVVIPNSVTRIEDYAFYYNGIKSVDIPETVKYIGKFAFSRNSLTNVVIPSSVETIENGAFEKSYTGQVENPIVSIINKTGRSFDWKSITGGSSNATFVTGTIKHRYGDIKVVDK